MRLLFFICYLTLPMPFQAQNINLNYNPRGQIIQFNFDSLTIYTDTTALFKVVKSYDNLSFENRIRSLIKKRLKKGLIKSKKDTIVFSGDIIPLKGGIKKKKKWYVDYVIIDLTEQNKLKIFDENNNIVTRIKKEIVNWSREGEGIGMIERSEYSYINLDTGKELFTKFINYIMVSPSW